MLGVDILDLKHFLLEKETNLLILFLDSVMLSFHRSQLLFDSNNLFLLLIDLVQLALQVVELGDHVEVPCIQVLVELCKLVVPAQAVILRHTVLLCSL